MEEKRKWSIRGYLNARELRKGMDTSTQGIFEADDIIEAIRLAENQGYMNIDFAREIK